MPPLTPDQAQRVTLAFVIAATIVIIAFDVVMIHFYGVEASISRVIQVAFRRPPIVMACVLVWIGILLGHVLFSID